MLSEEQAIEKVESISKAAKLKNDAARKQNTLQKYPGTTEITLNSGEEIDVKKKNVIDMDYEIYPQIEILTYFFIDGCSMIQDYYTWLKNNGFSETEPNPTNECVKKYYGNKPLWNTEKSKGIVVRDKNTDDYYIVMEGKENLQEYPKLQIVLTLGGCL